MDVQLGNPSYINKPILSAFSLASCVASFMLSLLLCIRFTRRYMYHASTKQLRLCIITSSLVSLASLIFMVVMSVHILDMPRHIIDALKAFATLCVVAGVAFNTITAIYRYERISGIQTTCTWSATRVLKRLTCIMAFLTAVIVSPTWISDIRWYILTKSIMILLFGIFASSIDYIFTVLMIRMTVKEEKKKRVLSRDTLDNLHKEKMEPLPKPVPCSPPLAHTASKQSKNLRLRLIGYFSCMLMTDSFLLVTSLFANQFTLYMDTELHSICTAIATIHTCVCLSLLQMFKSGLKLNSSPKPDSLPALKNPLQEEHISPIIKLTRKLSSFSPTSPILKIIHSRKDSQQLQASRITCLSEVSMGPEEPVRLSDETESDDDDF